MHSTCASPSAQTTTPEISSSKVGLAPGRRANAGRRSLAAPATKKSGKRSSVGHHLPALLSDRDRGRDDGRQPKGGTPDLRSTTAPAAAHTFTVSIHSERSSGDVAAAVADALPALRSLAGVVSEAQHGAHSPLRSALQKTWSRTDPRHFPSRASASLIRTPEDRTSPQVCATASSSPTLTGETLHDKKRTGRAVTVAHTGSGDVIEARQAHSHALAGPLHSTAAQRAGGAEGSATAVIGRAAGELGRAPERRAAAQVAGEEDADETCSDDEEDDEEDSDEGSDDDNCEDGAASDEEDMDTDSSSANDGKDEEDNDASTASSSSGSSTISTSFGSRKPQRKTTPNGNEAKRDSTTAVRETTTQQIRAKVSREGDVNVKVIFADRSHHGFRRFVREVMSRFGFQKVTDFDMYCIDQCGDRVDIDTEEDFGQLLDAFTDAMMAGKESLKSTPRPNASPPSSSAAPHSHRCCCDQSASGCGMCAAGDEVGTSGHIHTRAMSLNAGQRQMSSFYAAKSFSAPLGQGATVALPGSAGGHLEDDGKSSGGVLRLYVRHSNAYYTEHRREFEQQRHFSLHPQGIGSDGGDGTHQQQLLSSSSFSVKGGLPVDRFASDRTSPGGAGSPFVRTMLTSTVNSADNGGGGAGSASCRYEYYATHGHCSDRPAASPESVSLQFNETLASNLANTFRLEETKLVDWRRMSVLGKGSFGTVYEGITQDGKMLAVKVQEFPLDYCEDAEAVRALKTEINLMRSLKHKNIVAYYGCQTRVLPAGNEQMEVFLELCHGGSLSSLRRKFLKAKEPFSISLVRSYTRQVLEGLAYLHAQSVVHRDIKCDNVLISAMGEAKLADFGCSKRLGPATLQAMSGARPPGEAPVAAAAAAPKQPEAAAARAAMYHTMVGSPFFMAPEVLQGEGSYTGAADVWSVGCLVLELLGREPWGITGTNIFQIMYRISKESGMPSGVPKKCPSMLLDFFERCFQRDARQRSTAEELLAHEWLTCPDHALEEVPLSPPSQRELSAE
ncbi:hypothetical protein LSCM1_05528 [Leishmania martiniquensis]|uniref:Protein kinase domain-containing protein n=1 Tax=Leishmania martiniquensis TaxID=1580590 RepID=A0A836HRB7_9TRYP|nr:hypothetical protein LSCM1_05528 [Leishmania martiniquensis]